MQAEIIGEYLRYRLEAIGYTAGYPAAFKWYIDRLQRPSPGVLLDYQM
tara:strand:+ start:73109 stop:73252 length:144 start_codon:yes stop_codon:yes gene_type:complete